MISYDKTDVASEGGEEREAGLLVPHLLVGEHHLLVHLSIWLIKEACPTVVEVEDSIGDEGCLHEVVDLVSPGSGHDPSHHSGHPEALFVSEQSLVVLGHFHSVSEQLELHCRVEGVSCDVGVFERERDFSRELVVGQVVCGLSAGQLYRRI